jgi:hypothetical protein
MIDVFNEEDAALVLHFYENFNLYAHTTIFSDKQRLTKLERMGAVSSLLYHGSAGPDEYYLKLNKNHPDVKMIIDAMELL